MIAAIVLVLFSGFLHAVWNLYTKKSINKNVFLWFCQLVAIIAFLPWAISEFGNIEASFRGCLLLSASMVLHGLYVVLLAKAYTIGDLSQVYPIMRGTGPLLVPLIAVIFLNESLSVAGWVGVLFIVSGIASLGIQKKNASPTLKITLAALSVGCCISFYIIVDKAALEYVPAVVLNGASNVANLLALSFRAFSSGAIRTEWSINWKAILLGGLIAPGGYLLFLYALTMEQVSLLAPMREIGTVFGTLLGIFILHEQQGKKRIISSLVITIGVILLGTTHN